MPDCFWHRLSRPRPKILTPKSSPGRGEQQRHNPQFGRGLRLRQGTLRAWVADPRGRRAWALRLPGNSVGAGADLGTTFDGETSYGAALLGYQFRTQVLFLKLFAGVEAEDQSNTPRDPENSVRGSAIGLKLAAGSWFDLFRRSGSSASMLRTELRFSNIGAWRGRAIAFRHASRSGLKAARSATRTTTRAVAAAS